MAKSIKIGSIIHLQNEGNGYLDTRGLVRNKPEFWNVAGTEILFVTTNANRDRDRGSGSWRIISATGKKDGADLEYGDKIHLLNMYPGAGYLDCCGWVEHLPEFSQYAPIARCAVFTSDSFNRDNGTGLWEIQSDSPDKVGTVSESAHIRLKNGFPADGKFVDVNFSQTGVLIAHGDVAQNDVFNDQEDQLKFVFTSTQEANIADKWRITLNEPPEAINNNPANTYYVWGKEREKWVDFGIFELSGYSEPIVALNIDLTKENDGLEGTISYKGKAPVTLKAKREQNRYSIEMQPQNTTNESQPDNETDETQLIIEWTLGGRNDRNIININVSSPDNGHTFNGTISYEHESPIEFKGLRATKTLVKGESKTILYDFFQQGLWEARIKRIKEALQTAVIEFDDVLASIEESSIEKLIEMISRAGGKSYTYFEKDYYRLERIKKKEPAYGERVLTLFQNIGNDDAVDTKIKNEDAIAEKIVHDVELDHLNEKLAQLLKKQKLALPLEMAMPEELAPGASPDAQSEHKKIDIDFQLKQLLNIYTLWLSMNEFWETLSTQARKSIEDLNQANILPPVDQVRACFRQFTTDFEIIQNCIQQRRWVENEKNAANENIQATSLIVTDKLAARAMAPLKEFITNAEDIIPITYFSNRVNIRQLPYTDKFIFIGLMYDLTQPIQVADRKDEEITTTPFELMAIPHEVGHFIYRYVNLPKNQQHSTPSTQQTYETFATMSKMFDDKPYYHWCEEIFADLYGCFIAGPFAVLGMQALIATEEKHMVLKDDNEHPTGIFRPYFLSEMLRVLSDLKPSHYQFEKIAKLLDANWTAILERWGYVAENVKENGRPSRIHLPKEVPNHTESFINVDKAMELVKPIIEGFASELKRHATFGPIEETPEGEQPTKIPWCIGNDSTNNTLEDYIREIQELAHYKLASKPISDFHLSSKSQMKESLVETMAYALKGRIEYIGENLFKPILDGWGDKGPHGTGGHM